MSRVPHGRVDAFAAACLAFATVSAVFPPLRVMGNSTVLSTLALALWAAVSLTRRPGYFLRPTAYRLLTFGFAFYVTFVPYLFYNDTIGNRYLSLMLVTFGFIVYGYYEGLGQLGVLKRVIQVTVAFAAVTILRTAVGLISNPWLARSIKSSGEYSLAQATQGIGGYEIVYFAVVACPIALYAALNAGSVVKRVCWGVSYVLLVFLAVLSNYMTALLLISVSSGIGLLLHLATNHRRGITVVVTPLLLTMMILFGSQIVSGAVQGVMSLTAGGRTGQRLTTAGDSLVGGIQQEFAFDRVPVMRQSVDAALERPLGGLVTSRIDVSGGYLVGFGQHSHILDTFALFGFIVGGISLVVLFGPFVEHLRRGRQIALSLPVFISYAGVLLLNNAAPSIGVAACLVYPLVLSETNVVRPAKVDRGLGESS